MFGLLSELNFMISVKFFCEMIFSQFYVPDDMIFFSFWLYGFFKSPCLIFDICIQNVFGFRISCKIDSLPMETTYEGEYLILCCFENVERPDPVFKKSITDFRTYFWIVSEKYTSLLHSYFVVEMRNFH